MPRATVESVHEYEVDGSQVEFTCIVSVEDGSGEGGEHSRLPDRTVPVRLTFLSADTFRFELDAVPEVEGSSTTLDLDADAIGPPPELAVRETETELLIETSALRIHIGLDPWEFVVRNAAGERLLAEQREDFTAKAEQRTPPLGYDLELVNRWPYRRTGAGTSFVLDSHEHVYGLGETFTGFDKRGESVDCWITQPNGTETGHAYKNVPMYLSTAGYGLLVDTDQRTQFDIGDSSVVSTQISVDDDTFAFVFMGGPSFEDILETYTALTGRPDRVPRWSYGLWFSRLGYESQAEVEAVLDRADEEEIPVDVIHLDPPWLDELCTLKWDETAFPDPESFIESLHDRGVQLCLWEYPYLLSDTQAFEEAYEAGYLVEDGTGQPYLLDRLSWSSDRGAIVDFTDPEAASWWAERHRPLVEMGVDAFKCDFGEYLPTDAVLADGTTGRASRNRYPHAYVETVQEASEDSLLWVRAGWAGGQRFPVHWGGDPATTFESMAASLRGGLSLGLSGYGFWSADVGGFKGRPSTELYVRWAQFGLLGNSHVRFHGTTPREPWHFGTEATEIVRRYAQERYRLLPYLETLGAIAAERGLPVMRPLVLAFQDDHGARTCEDQLMLGPALLVAPVCRPGGRRDVYLPPGQWIDYWSGERVDGGRTVRRDLELEELPVYLRAGTVHPRTDLAEADPETRPDALSLRAALADGEAAGEVLDPRDGTLRAVSIQTNGEMMTIEAALGVDVTVEVVAMTDAPAAIQFGAEELSHVDGNPEPGEWTYDQAEETLIAVAPR